MEKFISSQCPKQQRIRVNSNHPQDCRILSQNNLFLLASQVIKNRIVANNNGNKSDTQSCAMLKNRISLYLYRKHY